MVNEKLDGERMTIGFTLDVSEHRRAAPVIGDVRPNEVVFCTTTERVLVEKLRTYNNDTPLQRERRYMSIFQDSRLQLDSVLSSHTQRQRPRRNTDATD